MADLDQRSEKEFSNLGATGDTDTSTNWDDMPRGGAGNVRPAGIVARGKYGGGNDPMYRGSSLDRSTSSVKMRGSKR